jgi:Fic family protein
MVAQLLKEHEGAWNMSLKIHKHYDYQTPFSAASNKDELAEIMRLKYPKACSNLETGAEFFARMVEDVRKYEAWRVIGFDSFEEFCRDKLGKTLDEVEEIVEGVKILGGNPTEEQAKTASKASRIRKLAEEKPEMKRADIAKATGATRAQVTRVLTKPRNVKKLTPNITVRMAEDPARTARNIHAKMGAEYAAMLKDAL